MSDPVRINLGAGSQEAPGWIGYDRSRVALLTRHPVTRQLVKERFGHWPPSTKVHDLTKGIPHPDGSVDVVYSSHMLEHLTREQGENLLKECHRVLKPGGLLRVIVPDMERLSRAYLEGDRALFHDVEGPMADAFAKSLYGGSRRKEATVRRAVKSILRADDGGHKWAYDETSLRTRLEEIGFRDVRRTERGESADPEAGALDIRSDWHLHMEATR